MHNAGISAWHGYFPYAVWAYLFYHRVAFSQAQEHGRDDHTSILPFSLLASASELQASCAQHFPALMVPHPHAAPGAPVVILGGTIVVRVPLAMSRTVPYVSY